METQTLIGKFEEGQEIEVKITKSKTGKFPIAIVTDTRIVCIFENLKKKLFFEIGSIWKVKISKVNPKNLVIYPIEQVKSAKEVDDELLSKIEQLKEKFRK